MAGRRIGYHHGDPRDAASTHLTVLPRWWAHGRTPCDGVPNHGLGPLTWVRESAAPRQERVGPIAHPDGWLERSGNAHGGESCRRAVVRPSRNRSIRARPNTSITGGAWPWATRAPG